MKANFLLVQPWLVVLLYRNDPICGLTLYWNTILVRSHTKYCVTSRIMIEKASNQRETDKLSLQNGWIFAFILMSQQNKKHLTNSKTMDPTKGHSLYQISSKMSPGSKVITLVGKKKKRGGLAGIWTHDLPVRSPMC